MTNLQKVCDVYDFFDPITDDILRNVLKAKPFGSRRAWEFATIYRALSERGKITEGMRGLAMGAGTERLIYAITPRVEHVMVTDLYTPDSSWVGVRTQSPIDLVMEKAPWPVPREKIDAMAMDMRDLKFPDESFDFCWSTGAFEHIGNDEDFLRHFAEVERVLKPGGVYVYTTAVTFNGATERIPHNYYFDPYHLMELAHASPLHPEPVFDCTIRDHIFNHPHPERFQDYGFKAGHTFSKTIISFRRGVLLTANSVILTKDRSRPKVQPTVIGYKETQARLQNQLSRYLADLWSAYQIVALDKSKTGLVTQPQSFGSGTVDADVIIPQGGPKKLQWIVDWRPVSHDYSWKKLDNGTVDAKEPTFSFKAVGDNLYRIRFKEKGQTSDERIILRLKRTKEA